MRKTPNMRKLERTCSNNCWSFFERVWNGTKQRTQRTAMNSKRAVVSCKTSQDGRRISIEDPFKGRSIELWYWRNSYIEKNEFFISNSPKTPNRGNTLFSKDLINQYLPDICPDSWECPWDHYSVLYARHSDDYCCSLTPRHRHCFDRSSCPLPHHYPLARHRCHAFDS